MQHEPTAKLEKINSASIKGPFQPDATKASRECADDTVRTSGHVELRAYMLLFHKPQFFV